jgi:hypothetical protein
MTQQLAVRRVVLYKHGVGYFERRGAVDGAAVVDLEFKSRDMNDVLKSLTVLDLNGGTVSAVSYDSTRPIEKLLEDAAVRIPDEGSVSSLLAQIKGARVRVRHGAESIEGVVLGTEYVQQAQGEVAVTRSFVALLIDGSVRSVPLMELRDLTLLDASVRRDVEYFLATVLSSHKKDARRVSVFATGEGRRELFVSYVIEAPVWKTTYRALLHDDAGPTLQGWAMVDNTGDEDWEDVDLALVAGLPVSFRHDLYSPRYMQRPEVRVKTEAAAAPVIPEEGFGGPPPPPQMAAPIPGPAALGGFGGPGAPPPAPRSMAKMSTAERANVMASSSPVTTLTKDVGDLFEYRIERPVTVRRNQSALVPILQCAMGGARVLLWNRATRERNPMACIELTNTSGLTLEGGPLTVTDGDLYVGEAMLDTMKPGDRRFVPYAVELGCLVTVDDKGESGSVYRATVAHGQLTTEWWQIRRTILTIRLKGTKPATLYLEHPKDDAWELRGDVAPAEVTERFHRFRVALTPGEVTFTVTERRRQWASVSLTNVRSDDVSHFVASRYIDEATAAAVREVMALQQQSSERHEQTYTLKQERDAIFQDQERLRQNLATLTAGAEQQQLAERLVRKLTVQEDRVEEIDAALARLMAEKAALDQEVTRRVTAIAYEARVDAP